MEAFRPPGLPRPFPCRARTHPHRFVGASGKQDTREAAESARELGELWIYIHVCIHTYIHRNAMSSGAAGTPSNARKPEVQVLQRARTRRPLRATRNSPISTADEDTDTTLSAALQKPAAMLRSARPRHAEPRWNRIQTAPDEATGGAMSSRARARARAPSTRNHTHAHVTIPRSAPWPTGVAPRPGLGWAGAGRAER